MGQLPVNQPAGSAWAHYPQVFSPHELLYHPREAGKSSSPSPSIIGKRAASEGGGGEGLGGGGEDEGGSGEGEGGGGVSSRLLLATRRAHADYTVYYTRRSAPLTARHYTLHM